jgi:hypothetical protein
MKDCNHNEIAITYGKDGVIVMLILMKDALNLNLPG